MKRLEYFNFIEEKLSLLATRIKTRGSLNILDLHVQSEGFYSGFLNLLFGWKLENQNAVLQNTPGIDLIDSTHKIIIQVSGTSTKQKIESSLSKDLSKYKGYNFIFLSISLDASDLRTKAYKIPDNIVFSPENDIIDNKSILRYINNLDIEKIKGIYEFLKKEFKSDASPRMVESNLVSIINILSKVDWNQNELSIVTDSYDIEGKILYNQLDSAKALIEEYKIYYSRINKIYSDFDKQGANKSLSILNGIKKDYLTLISNSTITPDQQFFEIIDKIVQRVQYNNNYTSIPEDEISLYVGILVVDAFIRCKIFKHPL